MTSRICGCVRISRRRRFALDLSERRSRWTREETGRILPRGQQKPHPSGYAA